MGIFKRRELPPIGEAYGGNFKDVGSGRTQYALATDQGEVTLGIFGESRLRANWNFGCRWSDMLDLCGVEIVSVDGVPEVIEEHGTDE